MIEDSCPLVLTAARLRNTLPKQDIHNLRKKLFCLKTRLTFVPPEVIFHTCCKQKKGLSNQGVNLTQEDTPLEIFRSPEPVFSSF